MASVHIQGRFNLFYASNRQYTTNLLVLAFVNYSLSLFFRVFESDSSKFLQLCNALTNHLALWEVAMVTLASNDDRGFQVFAKWLNDSLSITTGSVADKTMYLRNQKEIFVLSVRACLAVTPPDDLFNDQGQPLLVNYYYYY